MKKIFIKIFVLVMAVSLLSACGAKQENKTGDADKAEITFLSTRTDIADTTLRDFADKFETANPGIKLTIEAVKDYVNIAKTRLAAGELTDVFRQIPDIKKTDWDKYYLPLNDLEVADDMMFVDYNSHNGTLYSISTYANYSGMIYNKNAFKKAGITEMPKTLDELYAACEKLKAVNVIPTSAFYKDKFPTANWTFKLAPVMTNTADCFTPMLDTDKPFVKGTPMYDAVGLYRSFYDKGNFEKDLMSTSWEGFKPAFAKGEFGWILSETWLIPQIIENGASSDDIGFVPFPYDNSGTAKTYMIPDDTLAINKESKHPEAAKAFLDYVMNDGYEDWLNITGGFSTRKSYNGEVSPQVEEFLSYNPIKVERVRESDDVIAVKSKAQIAWEDLALQSLDSPAMDAAMEIFNTKWAKARAK